MLTSFTVIGGKASESLAKKIAKKLNARYLKTEVRVFPDGESKITLQGKPKKGKIIVVQSTYPPVDTRLIHALCLISKARQYSSDVTAVIPYMGYARQDKTFLSGEVVTSSVVATLLEAVGSSKIIVVDFHSLVALKYFRVPIKNLTAVSLLLNFFKKIKIKDPLVVSPDLFWASKAREFASCIGANSIALNKQRDRKTGKLRIKKSKITNIKGRDIILLDDMISSGESIIKASEFLKKRKCGKIFVACTHAVLVGDAKKRIKKAGVRKIVSTNTIPGLTNVADVSGIIADSIKN